MNQPQSPKKNTPFLEQHHQKEQHHNVATQYVPQEPVPVPVMPPLDVPYRQNIIIIEEIPMPIISYCSYCNAQTETYEAFYDGAFVWLMCLLLWFFTLFFFWVAFCIPEWKDIEFRCVRCDRIKFIKQGRCC